MKSIIQRDIIAPVNILLMSQAPRLMPDDFLLPLEDDLLPNPQGWSARPRSDFPYRPTDVEPLFDVHPPGFSSRLIATLCTNLGDKLTEIYPPRVVIYPPTKGFAGITELNGALVITTPPFVLRGEGPEASKLRLYLHNNGVHRDEEFEQAGLTTEPWKVIAIREAGKFLREMEYFQFFQTATACQI